jgi:hypothetical protein
LDGKRILAEGNKPDVLMVLEERILTSCPNCRFDKTTTYEWAAERMLSSTYSIAILDTMEVRGFDLLELAVSRNFPVMMITPHALNPESLKKSFEMKVRAYPPKEKLGEIVPFLEDV